MSNSFSDSNSTSVSASTQLNVGAAEVVDFASIRKSRIEDKKQELETDLKSLKRAGMMTTINLKRVERSVLGLTSAFTTQELLHEIATNLAPNMAVDFVSLCMESEEGRLTDHKVPGIYWLTPGSLDAAMHGEDIIMSSSGDDYVRVFGQDASSINSCALIQLEMPDLRTRGVLAFGAKAHGYFSPEQGTELVAFLGKITEQLLTRVFMAPSRSNVVSLVG